uniref:DEAD/DEAH-box helicase domain-containing protein n=1 Tax=Cyprinus carpio carpio TaxID=630221 RepID=A0A9J8B1F6_CYPCA
MRDESTEPTYGCQVTIQSEQEKQMMKIYRKEEKKERKREKRGDTCENKFHFDPKEMRSQRQDTSSARSRTLCRHSENDRQTTTTRSSFLMLLPEGIRRENNKMYEEVEIPHNEPMPTGFKEKPVYILELDEIGQLVFKGIKRLNAIQSIVFETAYNTNENLLIHAPNGVGKTSITMLTILHEIRQHLQPGGVICKDQFKILYVAPMKALAAEMTNYLSKRLVPLGIAVKELTGDMQLTKGEILHTQLSAASSVVWRLRIVIHHDSARLYFLRKGWC